MTVTAGCIVSIVSEKSSTFVGDTTILTVATIPLTSTFSVDLYKNGGIAETLIVTISRHGVCSTIWDTTGLTVGTYGIQARIGTQCESPTITVVLTGVQEVGMGGIGMLLLAGIGITALMSMKKPVTK